MRNARKYTVIILLTALLALVAVGNAIREYWRMEVAVFRQHEEYVLKGAKTYAENCAQCHGPRGEGVIGMPLNRKEYQVDYTSPNGRDVYRMLTETIRQGRAGNADHFQWVQVGDKWISYTEMPAWGRDYGGSLDEDYIHALALFIMKEDGTQWSLVGNTDKAPFPDTGLEEYTGRYEEIPLPDSANTEVNEAAQALLRDIPRSQCLTCHVIGTVGGKIGPDLSRVGSWGIDQAFLEEWIKYANVGQPGEENPEAMPHDRRMPVYWAAHRANTGPELNLENPVISEGPYYMTRFHGRLTDEEISLIAEYLMGLK